MVKIVKYPGNGLLNNLNYPVLNVLILIFFFLRFEFSVRCTVTPVGTSASNYIWRQICVFCNNVLFSPTCFFSPEPSKRRAKYKKKLHKTVVCIITRLHR